MYLQVGDMQGPYCLLKDKPKSDEAKTIRELELDMIQLYKDGIEILRASNVNGRVGEREKP